MMIAHINIVMASLLLLLLSLTHAPTRENRKCTIKQLKFLMLKSV